MTFHEIQCGDYSTWAIRSRLIVGLLHCKFSILRMVNRWHRLPRELVDFICLEDFRKQQDKLLNKLIWIQSLFWAGILNAFQCFIKLQSPPLNCIFFSPCVLQLRIKGIPAVFPEIFAIREIRGSGENWFMSHKDSFCAIFCLPCVVWAVETDYWSSVPVQGVFKINALEIHDWKSRCFEVLDWSVSYASTSAKNIVCLHLVSFWWIVL